MSSTQGIARNRARWQGSLPSFATWAISAGLVVYLGMQRGGYELPVYSEIGLAAWCAIGAGVLAGAISVRIGTPGWVGFGLFAAYVTWTAASLAWTESAGRSMIELVRLLVLAGVFGMALQLAGGGRQRAVLGGVATGIAIIAAIALLSRLEPTWFPDNRLPEVLVGTQSRLAYPIGYWNALAGLIAIGVPLCLGGAVSARTHMLRGVAAAAIPVLLLASYFTFSRAGIAITLLATIAFVALSERRLDLLAPLGIVGAASAALIWQASVRDQLSDGLATEVAASQGHRMLVYATIVAILAGVAVATLSLGAARGWIPRSPSVPRRTALAILGSAAVLGLLVFVGFGGPEAASDAFTEFKDPAGLSETSTRLSSFGGNGRWQYWSSALEANDSARLTGIGPGTFAFWWSANREIDTGLIRDAHSLYMEALAELGIVGFLLLCLFVFSVLAFGVVRALESVGERRLELASASAAALAFSIGAGLDWLWELTVLPAVFLIISAAILRTASSSGEEGREMAARRRGARGEPTGSAWLPRGITVLVVAVAASSMVVIAFAYESDRSLTRSQEQFRAGDIQGALSSASRASDLQPFAAEPIVQEALVLESAGELSKAAGAARDATEKESTNWETWYVLARIQQQRGKEGAALIALRRAQELNPISQVLNPIRCGKDGSRCLPAPIPQ